jgi:hypothetical protein
MDKDNVMELAIYNLEDRLQVSKILIKNGYKVSQKKRAKPGSTALTYYLRVEEGEEDACISR